tara:strand:- start:1665 stop:2480 length:816 start_codon:yes stop_codon:yes gene_type:complete
MKDLTYILPTRIESEDRLKNIITSVLYLLKNFPEAKVIVKEVSDRATFKFRALPEIKKIASTDNLRYIFEESNDPLFHKTRILNDLIMLAKTSVICSHDVDVVYPVSSHRNAYKLIQDNQFDIIYPYGCGVWQYQVDYPMEVFQEFLASGFDMNIIQPRCKTESSTIGWTQFYSKDAVLRGGLWNENFLSWGAEDCEFYFRYNKLGFRVGRVDDWIWHFEHGRTHNSHYHNPKFVDNNNLWQWLKNQDKETIIKYMNEQEYVARRFKDAGI